MKTKAMFLMLALAAMMLGSMGCSSKAKTGTLVGAGTGAAAGAIIGHQSGHKGEGALIGGAVGAAGGYMIGNEMDKSDAKKQQQPQQTQSQPPQQQQSAPQQGNQSTPWKDNQQSQAAITHTVTITNSNGSTTPVTLTKQGDDWVGPKGEHYKTLPTEEQLKPVYGF